MRTIWIGKVVGGLLGYMAGDWVGALIGVLLGHWIDRGLAGASRRGGRLRELHRVFFRTTFQAMGYVCKADGRVSEAEIAIAEAIMGHMSLSEAQRQEAIAHFHAGKAEGFDLDAALDDFRRHGGRHPNLVRMFLEIQIQAAFADGRIDAAEHEAMLHIARRLGLSAADYARLEALLIARARGAAPTAEEALPEAYKTLGIESAASNAEIKRAYRRLINQHHPDKLVARGLPEAMVNIAQERAQEIQTAYDVVKRARGMR